MKPIHLARISLVLAGAATFLVGVRYEIPAARWVGLAFMVVSFLLKFANRRPPTD